jgi:hypothetical protein
MIIKEMTVYKKIADKMTVDEMTLYKMIADKMTVDEMTCCQTWRYRNSEK